MIHDLIVTANTLLEEIYKFSDDMVHLGLPIIDERLLQFEKKIGFTLPGDFKYIINRHNGISLAGTEVYGIDKILCIPSLDEVYEFEHNSALSRMPIMFLPFSPDGRGNHYCLDLSTLKNDTCKVVFWQHDLEYERTDHVEVCNNDFCSWVQEVMIDWTLEDYNYDGSLREQT